MIKTCPICKVESKALHMHMKKHKETQIPEQERVLNQPEEIKLTEDILNAAPEPTEEVKNVNNCEYHITMHFNDRKFECFTNNIKISMLSFRPEQVFTEGYIKIEKGTAMFERKYPLVELRKILKDDERLDIFISNLILG